MSDNRDRFRLSLMIPVESSEQEGGGTPGVSCGSHTHARAAQWLAMTGQQQQQPGQSTDSSPAEEWTKRLKRLEEEVSLLSARLRVVEEEWSQLESLNSRGGQEEELQREL
uniref:Uncharacterized protein n=1 Tax=Sphaerodactylus townsendi TaxID=933632 RepID=A0ACB8E5I6_9SAUR